VQSKIFALWQCENPDAFSRLHRFCLSISRRLVVLPSSITPQKITASQVHPLKFTQTLRNYPSTSIQGTKRHYHLDHNLWNSPLFKHIQRQTQAHSSSRHYRYKNYALQNYFTTLFWQRLVNNDILLHPAQAKYIS
jgi:hypothetical protein